jgi:DNA-binding helix-hairpin-helix protein with protein kinase domain
MKYKTLRDSKGEIIELESKVASSGEGEVWRVKNSDLVAKIYHENPTKEQIEKLRIMMAYPPNNPNEDKIHIPWAWPKSFLLHGKSKVGFLMDRIKGGRQIVEVYSPQMRRIEDIDSNWQFLHAIALNFATIVRSLHSAGYVIGDIKAQNVLTNSKGKVSIVDIDSIQVKSPVGEKVYTCGVGTVETTPPELIGKILKEEIQTEAQDRFRMGIIIFQLLFGEHPFKQPQSGSPLKIEELILQGKWIGQISSAGKGRLIPLEVVHPKLQDCFKRCFESSDPNLRPTAHEWKKAIEKAYEALVPCRNIEALPNKSHPHFYSRHQKTCYWCERANSIGFDIFGQNAITHVKSSELTRLIRLDKKVVRVKGTVTGVSAQGNKIVLRLGKGNRSLKCGAFEIVIDHTVVTKLSEEEKKNFLSARGKEMSVKGTISVCKTKNQSTPKVIIDNQPVPCTII